MVKPTTTRAARKTVRPAQAVNAKPALTLRPQIGTYVTLDFWPELAERAFLSAYGIAFTLMQSEWWPAAELARLQLERADKLLRFARDSVPFYRERLADAVAGERLDFERFAHIPILTRAEVQAAGAALRAPKLPERHGPAHDVHTSGSSGEPVSVASTRLAHLTNAAATLRGHQWFRRSLAGSNVTIQVPKHAADRFRTASWAPGSSGRSLIYNNRVPVEGLHRWLLADDPDYLQCHPSILRELIHRSASLGRRPGRLCEVRTMGEVLEPGLRALCRREWGIPVRDNYSCEELGTLALQCPEHDHMHVQSERAIVEIVDDDGRPCRPGELGRVVVTGLFNYATPLIRYELGDRAIAGEACPCGRGLPVIQRLVGRERHAARLPDGGRVFPTLDFEPLLLGGGVRQYQVAQTDVEDIEVRLVASRRLSTEEETGIAERLRRNLGHPFRVGFAYVDAIARGAGGKFQLFRSELEAEGGSEADADA